MFGVRPVALVHPKGRTELLHHRRRYGDGMTFVGLRPVALRRPPDKPVMPQLVPIERRMPGHMLGDIRVGSEIFLVDVVELNFRRFAGVVDRHRVIHRRAVVLRRIPSERQRGKILVEITPAGTLRVKLLEIRRIPVRKMRHKNKRIGLLKTVFVAHHARDAERTKAFGNLAREAHHIRRTGIGLVERPLHFNEQRLIGFEPRDSARHGLLSRDDIRRRERPKGRPFRRADGDEPPGPPLTEDDAASARVGVIAEDILFDLKAHLAVGSGLERGELTKAQIIARVLF